MHSHSVFGPPRGVKTRHPLIFHYPPVQIFDMRSRDPKPFYFFLWTPTKKLGWFGLNRCLFKKMGRGGVTKKRVFWGLLWVTISNRNPIENTLQKYLCKAFSKGFLLEIGVRPKTCFSPVTPCTPSKLGLTTTEPLFGLRPFF